MNEKPNRSFTLGMIKSHAITEGRLEDIISMIKEKSDLRILDQRLQQLKRDEAAQFYAEHEGRPFFEGLIESVTSGPVYALLLGSESYGAIREWRELAGATNPAEAKSWTIRAKFGRELPFNAVHGADSPEAFKREAEFFFGVLPGITRSI